MVKRNKKGALQDKGVRQLKKFHLEDEPRNLHQDVLQDKPILPKQVTKVILAIVMFRQMTKVLIHKPLVMLLLIQFYLESLLTKM